MQKGIVRRMDDLGRVVIPKEMRKALRIKEGTPLEIFANENELIVKKYSPVFSIKANASEIAMAIEEITGKTAIITDTDKVIFIVKNRLRELLNKNISTEYEKVLKERKSIVINKIDGGTIVPIVKGQEFQIENEIIVPITNNGDCYGGIIVFDELKDSRFSLYDVKLVQFGANILSRQID